MRVRGRSEEQGSGNGSGHGNGRPTPPVVPVVQRRKVLEVTPLDSPSDAPLPRSATRSQNRPASTRLLASALHPRGAWLGGGWLILRWQPSSPSSARASAWRSVLGPAVRPGTLGGSGTGVQRFHLVPVVHGWKLLEATSIVSTADAPVPRPAPGLRTWLRRPGFVTSCHWPSGRPLRHDGIA